MKNIKVSQFADDTSIFLDGSSQSLNSTLEELDRLCKNIRPKNKL